MFPILVAFLLIITFIIISIIAIKFVINYLKENQNLKSKQNEILENINEKLNQSD
jgi:ABC-type dipeptide/oligopeptide/nickel transport system permease component